MDYEQLALALLAAVTDGDQPARAAAAARIDAADCWSRVGHYLAGLHAGYLEATAYRAATGRHLLYDTDRFTAAA